MQKKDRENELRVTKTFFIEISHHHTNTHVHTNCHPDNAAQRSRWTLWGYGQKIVVFSGKIPRAIIKQSVDCSTLGMTILSRGGGAFTLDIFFR